MKNKNNLEDFKELQSLDVRLLTGSGNLKYH